MQSIAETCVRFDAAHLSINLVSEIAVPMFTTLRERWYRRHAHQATIVGPDSLCGNRNFWEAFGGPKTILTY